MRLGVRVLLIVAALSASACKRSPTCDATDSVSIELCGPRSAWVGQWVAGDFGPHGGYRYTDDTPHHHRLVEGDIVAFEGADIKVRMSDSGEQRVIHVDSPPTRAGGTWSMTVEGVVYAR